MQKSPGTLSGEARRQASGQWVNGGVHRDQGAVVLLLVPCAFVPCALCCVVGWLMSIVMCGGFSCLNPTSCSMVSFII